jgi:hypothetical protein
VALSSTACLKVVGQLAGALSARPDVHTTVVHSAQFTIVSDFITISSPLGTKLCFLNRHGASVDRHDHTTAHGDGQVNQRRLMGSKGQTRPQNLEFNSLVDWHRRDDHQL